jgi:hypothetical protein
MAEVTDITEYAAEKGAEKNFDTLMVAFPELRDLLKEIDPYVRAALLIAFLVRTIEDECDPKLYGEKEARKSLASLFKDYRGMKDKKTVEDA